MFCGPGSVPDACGDLASAAIFVRRLDLANWLLFELAPPAVAFTFQPLSAYFITALALCAESLVLHGRGNNRMAAMIKAHPGLKPLEEVDSEMSELIAQEQRRQACAPRPKPLRERGGRPDVA